MIQNIILQQFFIAGISKKVSLCFIKSSARIASLPFLSICYTAHYLFSREPNCITHRDLIWWWHVPGEERRCEWNKKEKQRSSLIRLLHVQTLPSNFLDHSLLALTLSAYTIHKRYYSGWVLTNKRIHKIWYHPDPLVKIPLFAVILFRKLLTP